MKNFIYLIFLLPIIAFANGSTINMKKCEKIQISKYTTLLSCHKLDYLVEYQYNDDEEKDNIKKITAISLKDAKIILKTVR